MKRSEIQSVGDVLRMALEENDLAGRLEELKAAELWPQVVGSHLASMTLRPYIRAGTMTVRVPDASLRHELSMHRTLILREINRLLGKDLIHTLRLNS